MPVFVVGDLLLGLPGPAHLLLLFFFVFCAAPAVGFAVRRRLRIDAARRDEVLRLAAFAAEESDRAEREATFEYYAECAAAAAAVAASRHQCAVCFRPTTTRCARCKAVRYCSGKCQIIHWRQGHKDDCHLLSAQPMYTAYGSDINKKLESLDDEERETERGGVRSEDQSHDKLFENSAKNFTSGYTPVVSTAKKDHVVNFRPSVDLKEKDFPFSSCSTDNLFGGREDEACVKSTIAVSPEANGFSATDVSCDSKQSKIAKTALDSSSATFSATDDSISKKQKSASLGSDGHLESRGVKTDGFQNIRHFVASDSSIGQVAAQSSPNFESDSLLKFSFNLSGQTDPTAVCVSNVLPKKNVNEEIFSDGTNSYNINETISQGSHIFGSERSSSLLKERGGKTFNFREQSSPSFSASNDLQYSSLARHSSSSDASLNLSKDHSGYNTSMEPPMSSLNSNNALKTSMLKVVQQFKSPKLTKPLHPLALGHATSGKSGYKMLFSYDLFSKLYQEKVELFPCGLTNCGNSCFANAVLQCLTFTRPLTAYFLRGLHSKKCTKNDWCFTCEFERLVQMVKQGKSPISPVEILSHINLGHGKEEDAHEFLRCAIDAMQSVCLMEAGNSVTSTIIENTTLIQLIFGGYLKSKIKCMKCQGKSEIKERMLDLTVEIQGDIGTLEEALKQFTSTETLDGENKYRCDRCKSYEKARKRLKIVEAPNILTIALKRFQSGKFGKLNKLVTFPEILNLAPYMSASSDKSPVYSLYAVVVHLDIMNAAFSGHYVCYVKSGQGKWYKTDDSMVKPVEWDRVLSKGAYLLLYARCSPRAPSLHKNPIDHVSNGKISRASEAVPTSHEGMSRFKHVSVHNLEDDHQWMDLRHSEILERMPSAVDSSSDNCSLFSCSDEGSCSTDSTRDSTSNDDISEYIFGDSGHNGCNIPINVGDESEGSSVSPLYSRRSPLSVSSRSSCDGYFKSDVDSLKRNASTGKGNLHTFCHKNKDSRNLTNRSSFSSGDSDWEKIVGSPNPCEVKSNVTLRRPRDRTQTYY